MPAVRVVELGEGRQMIDVGFRDTEGLVASFVVPMDDGVTVVETGPTTCLPRLRQGLADAGVDPSEVRRILVTHIHLDHAGGLGAASAMFPRATLYVHERGAAHLVDPTKLIASARRAWGPAADPIWGTIAPAPASRLHALHGGERLPVRGGELVVVATPGHAQHHLAFLDVRTRSVMTGDAAGVRLTGAPRPRPAIPPPDLDLEALFRSVDEISALEPRRLLYTHFGPSEQAARDLRVYKEEVTAWRDAALDAARVDASVANVARALEDVEHRRALAAGAEPLDLARGELVSGYELAAQGLLRYFRTHALLPE